MTEVKPARVRFAPSPTGNLHIGGARTALYNYLLARQTGGQFILRIEDTDQTRFVEGAMEEQMNSLRWLGLHWDEGPDVGGPHAPYIQSQRADIHRAQAGQLVETGKAYYCFCTKERLDAVRNEQLALKRQPRYDGHCRDIPPVEAKARKESGEPCVVRFNVPTEGSTTVRDLIRGEITVENSTLDDFIILKSDGLSLYHLAAMVDDHLMGITHVIRSSEWIPSLPKHALVHRAFGWEEPVWVHLSVFLKPSGKGKLSKRDVVEGHAILVHELPALGFTPEAILNWIALMGWSLDDKTDVLTLDEMIKGFSLERINPSPAAINFDKLDYFSGVHIRALPQTELAKRIQPFFARAGLNADENALIRIAPIIQGRIETLDESVSMAGFFFRPEVKYDSASLIPKGMDAASALAALQKSAALLRALPDLTHSTTEPPMRALADELKLKPGQLFGILRVAITGQTVSPPLFETIALLDRDTVFKRLEQAENMLSGQ
ncbi:MAG TPA: glutamate--tRNA ligase [Anaerolineales bacterium]|nr:glutamate--tRNA ligase [Anaerolineales bacterium]